MALAISSWLVALAATVAFVKVVGMKRPIAPVASLPRSGPIIAHGHLYGDRLAGSDVIIVSAGWYSDPVQLSMCRLEATHLVLSGEGASLRVDSSLGRPNFLLGRTDLGFDGRLADAPPALASMCPFPTMADVGPSGAVREVLVFELTVHDGADVYVAGCRAGDVIAPCGDALDGLASAVNAETIPDDAYPGGILARHDVGAGLPILRAMEVTLAGTLWIGAVIAWLLQRRASRAEAERRR